MNKFVKIKSGRVIMILFQWRVSLLYIKYCLKYTKYSFIIIFIINHFLLSNYYYTSKLTMNNRYIINNTTKMFFDKLRFFI